MTKPEIEALGRLFSAEIDAALSPHRLPLVQSKAKVFTKLAAEGLAEEVTVTLPGRLSVRVTGWGLTLLGHQTYCANC